MTSSPSELRIRRSQSIGDVETDAMRHTPSPPGTLASPERRDSAPATWRSGSVSENVQCLLGKHVAVVEDSEAVAKLIMMHLTKQGANSIRFANANEWLNAALDSSNHWDAVVLDHNLPGMTGLDAIHALGKIHEVYCSFPLYITYVVFIS